MKNPELITPGSPFYKSFKNAFSTGTFSNIQKVRSQLFFDDPYFTIFALAKIIL
jgi:hypothetical protein